MNAPNTQLPAYDIPRSTQPAILVRCPGFKEVISINPSALSAFSNTPGTSLAKLNAPSLLANKYPFLISLPHFVQTILDSSIKFTKKAALKIHIRKISTASLRLSYNIISYLSVTSYYSNQKVTCQVQ